MNIWFKILLFPIMIPATDFERRLQLWLHAIICAALGFYSTYVALTTTQSGTKHFEAFVAFVSFFFAIGLATNASRAKPDYRPDYSER